MTTASTLKARPIHATFLAAAGIFGWVAASCHFFTPADERDQHPHRRPKTPGGSEQAPPAPAAGPDPGGRPDTGMSPQPPAGLPDELAGAPWPDDNDGDATAAWLEELAEPEPPLDPLPPDVVLHSQRDVAWPGVWEPPTALLTVDGIRARELAELTGAPARDGWEAWRDHGRSLYLAAATDPYAAHPGDPLLAAHVAAAAQRREPRQHYATGLCWCGGCHDQAVSEPEPPTVTDLRPVTDRASLRDFVGAAMRMDVRPPPARRFTDAVLAGKRSAALARADELLAQPLPLTGFYSEPWQLEAGPE